MLRLLLLFNSKVCMSQVFRILYLSSSKTLVDIHASIIENDRIWKPKTVREIARGHRFHGELNKEALQLQSQFLLPDIL